MSGARGALVGVMAGVKCRVWVAGCHVWGPSAMVGNGRATVGAVVPLLGLARTRYEIRRDSGIGRDPFSRAKSGE